MKKKKHRVITGKTLAFLIGIVSFASVLVSCSGEGCNGKNCDAKLGFTNKLSERDSLFDQGNPFMASTFKVYIENSLSMDAYVSEDFSSFKISTYQLINQVVADVLADEDSLSLNYINSDSAKYIGDNPKRFTNGFSPKSFAEAGGNRSTSDIIEIISEVVKLTGKGELSMFVSDCVYSPMSSEDSDKGLKRQRTDMTNILKSKAKTDSTFGVLVYRLMSNFKGTYYNKTDRHIPYTGERPYYVWFFGEESLLANVRATVSKIMTEERAQYYGAFPGYNYVPYRASGADHGYHFVNKEAGDSGTFTFSFYANMSRLPVSADYIMNDSNYVCGNPKRYWVSSIKTVTPNDKKGTGYDYKYEVKVTGAKNKMVTGVTVDLSMKSQQGEIPGWVETYDDPVGNITSREDLEREQEKTFGIKSLIEGVADFYNEPYYTTFKFKVN